MPPSAAAAPATDDIEVRSPYDGAVVARLPSAGPQEARDAVAAAEAAMRQPLPAAERAAILDRLSRALEEHREELAGVIVREAGKPVTAALAEVGRAAATLHLAAGEAERLTGEPVALGGDDGRFAVTVRVPIGVVAAITPFNFPLNLVAHKVAPALAAGCAVVLKPAEKTPSVALRFAELAAAAGLPPGWLNVVVGHPEPIADVLCEDPRVELITFTGSGRIGWDLRARAPRKQVKLELGNATPVIVAQDADLDAAATAIVTGGFGFAGQACISVQRVYAHAEVLEDLTARVVERAATLPCGDPTDPAVVVGPLVSAQARDRVLEAAADAETRGARRLTGGPVEGNVIAPIVLTGAPEDAIVERQEVFGPVVSINGYEDFDDALARANATEYGLQAGVFTRDLGHALRSVQALRFGGVCINESPTFRADAMPYGGVKASGNTREGPAYAIREMTEERLAVVSLPALS